MNVYRSRHQVSPLSHNRELTSIAQSWADHLATSGSLSHNPKASYRGENLGENCAMRWTSDRQDFTGRGYNNVHHHHHHSLLQIDRTQSNINMNKQESQFKYTFAKSVVYNTVT